MYCKILYNINKNELVFKFFYFFLLLLLLLGKNMDTTENKYKFSRDNAKNITCIDTPGQSRTLWHYTNTPNGSLSFGTERLEANCIIPTHSHIESDEIIFVYNGMAKCSVGDSICIVKEGEAICIPKGTNHSIENMNTDKELDISWTLTPPQTINQFRAD